MIMLIRGALKQLQDFLQYNNFWTQIDEYNYSYSYLTDTWLLLMGPNPREGDATGEPREGLITEKGEPMKLVGLLEAELLGWGADMARKLPAEENDVPSSGCQSEVETRRRH